MATAARPKEQSLAQSVIKRLGGSRAEKALRDFADVILSTAHKDDFGGLPTDTVTQIIRSGWDFIALLAPKKHNLRV